MFRNPHWNTIYASLLRPVPRVRFARERLELDDGDFLDLDWSRTGSRKLLIVLPGLEGKSRSLYTRAAVRYFNENGWDCLVPNYRGCSGDPNRLLRGYHMGASDDLDPILDHLLASGRYDAIAFAGYSLGGNIALKYVGERAENLPKEIIGIVSFSAPMNLRGSCARLDDWDNWHFQRYFMFGLNWKAYQMKRRFPGQLNYNRWGPAGNFRDYDRGITAPANGFPSVDAYYAAASCLPVLPRVNVPSLIVAAQDDTFITPECVPHELAAKHPHLYLETPRYGGHCGFIRQHWEPSYWMEERALAFLESHLATESSTTPQQHPRFSKTLDV